MVTCFQANARLLRHPRRLARRGRGRDQAGAPPADAPLSPGHFGRRAVGLRSPTAWPTKSTSTFPSVLTVLDSMRQSFFGAAGALRVAGPTSSSRRAKRSGARSSRSACRCGGPARSAAAAAKSGATGAPSAPASAICPAFQAVNLRVPAGVQDGTRVRFRVAAPGIRETLIDARIVIK